MIGLVLAVVLAGQSLAKPDLAADAAKLSRRSCRYECMRVEFEKLCNGVEYPANASTSCGAQALLVPVCTVGAEVCR